MPQIPSSVINQDRLDLLVKLAADTPPGPFVEVGVYQGGSAWLLMQVAQRQGRVLHLFDTFTGIPHAREIDKHRVGDFSDTSFEVVQAAIPDAVFHVGVFPETLPDDLVDIAFVHADCDQYDSVRAVIDYLRPRMIPGGIMVFDDYNIIEGARMACDETFPQLRETAADGALAWIRTS